MQYDTILVALAKLQLNNENDRHGLLDSQRDCIMWMLEYLGDEIYNLAEDIAEHGLSPLDNILVLPAGKEAPGEYVVLEGNRRVTALKLLEDPNRCESPKLVKRFRALAQQASLPEELRCVVAPSVEEADRLLELRHQGPQGGVGTVPWTGAQKSRHQARLGKRGRYAYTQDVLDSIADKLEEDLRDQVQSPGFPISTLDRLLKNGDVRDFLGLADEDGKPRRFLHEAELVKGLSKMLRDIGNKKIRVNDVYSASRQREYLRSFGEDERPDKSRTLKDSVALTPPRENPPIPVVRPPRSMPLSRDRRKLIPSSVRYRITDRRLNSIYTELRKLDVQDFPNAVAVAFRVFLELASELYMDHHGIGYHSFNDKLHKKVSKAVAHAIDNNWLDKRTGKGVSTKLSDRNSLIGADTLNAYVHSAHYHPAHQDLNVMWDNLEPFFDAILNHLD